jgi:hypothetical protein
MVNQRLRLLFRLLLLSGCCALITGTVHAQLNDRPYQQWTAKEAEALLFDSPWAQTRSGLVAAGRWDPLTEAANTAVTLSLRSALPVRQALARLRQLKNRYDKKMKFVNPKFVQDDAVFYFSRFNSKGEPLISPANRKLTISFDPRILRGKRRHLQNSSLTSPK